MRPQFLLLLLRSALSCIGFLLGYALLERGLVLTGQSLLLNGILLFIIGLGYACYSSHLKRRYGQKVVVIGSILIFLCISLYLFFLRVFLSNHFFSIFLGFVGIIGVLPLPGPAPSSGSESDSAPLLNIEEESVVGAEKAQAGFATASGSNEKAPSATQTGKRPLEVSQDSVWDDVDRVKRQKNILSDSDWNSDWVTARQDELGKLLNELRAKESMRTLAPNRLQAVVESLEAEYTTDHLGEIINDVRERGLASSYYQESKIDRDLPTEAALKAAAEDVTKQA